MADGIEKAAPPGPPPSGNAFAPSNIGPQGNPNAGPFQGIGVSGLKAYSGIVNEEYLAELRGPQATRAYRMMSEGDSTVSAILTAISLILRAVDWRMEPADDSPEAEAEAEFAQTLLDDMSHPFEDFIAECLSMLVFGWAYHEIILKRRMGPDQKDPAKRSKYNDGRIGVRKLPIRSQDSLLRWEMQDDGGILGMWQIPPLGGAMLFVPIERALLFRTTSKKNSPEGVSVLRSAYRSWYLMKTIEDMEAIGIERELAGLPVVSIPGKYLTSQDAADVAIRRAYEAIARDVKFNQQGGAVVPSDCWPDVNGSPTAQRLVNIELLSTGGRRAIDTDPVVMRHQRNIARSVLADFLMLGDAKGSYNLSKNKSDLFLRSCETYLKQIATPINSFLLPRIWSYNGLNRDLMPQLMPGQVAPVDLAELGTYIQQLSSAGAPLFPNADLETYLNEIADLPKPPEETMLGAGPEPKPATEQASDQ